MCIFLDINIKIGNIYNELRFTLGNFGDCNKIKLLGREPFPF